MIFGAHESIAGGVYKAIQRGKDATCDTIQIFNKNNNSWRAAPLKPEDVEKYFMVMKTNKVNQNTHHIG